MSKAIDVVSLYPKDMNIYGDSGNVLAVERRLALYGYEPHVHAVNQNDPWPEHATSFWVAAARTPVRRRSSKTSSAVPTDCATSRSTACRCS